MREEGLHVLYVVRPRDGGAVRHAFELVRGMVSRGVRVTLVGDPRIDFVDEFTRMAEMIPMRFNRLPGVNDLRAVLTMRRILRTGSFDVVHAHCAGAGFVVRLANLFSRRRLPVVYTPHFYSFDMPDFGRTARTAFFLVEKVLAAVTDYTVCVSDAERKSAERLRSRRMSVVTIPNGIDVPAARPRPEADHRHPTRVYFIGRLSHEKAPDAFVQAWARIEHGRTDGPNAEAAIVGTGPLERRLRDRVSTLGLRTLELRGFVPDAARLLRPTDVVVIPSRHEALPYALLEAMAAECAIVASRVGGIPEWIVSGRNGLLIEPADVDGLADALERLVGARELRARLGAEACETLRERASLSEMLARHEQIYGALA
jgi:glycosyltransferase involved in cell wall biosynthesis